MDPKTEKVCPQCAEVIKVGARVCRFCGHQFSDEALMADKRRAATAQTQAQALALANAERRLTAQRVEDLESRRNGFLGCGVVIAVVGALLLLVMIAMFVTPPGEKTSVEQQRFSSLMCTTIGALPLLFIGFFCVRAGLRAHQQRVAYLENDEGRARDIRLQGKRSRWIEWGSACAVIGLMLLVIRLGFFPAPEDEKDVAGQQAAGFMCFACAIAPLFAGALFFMLGLLVTPEDDGPPEVGMGEGQDLASSPLGMLFELLDEKGALAFAAYLGRISTAEAAEFGQRLKRASAEELRRIAEEFNEEGRTMS